MRASTSVVGTFAGLLLGGFPVGDKSGHGAGTLFGWYRDPVLPARRNDPIGFPYGHCRTTWLSCDPVVRAGQPRWTAIEMTADRARLRVEDHRHALPVTEFRLVRSRPRLLELGPIASAAWLLELTHGEQRFTIRGTRLEVAWLAHLGGWDEPPRIRPTVPT